MSLFPVDLDTDVEIVCSAVGFLPNLGATLTNLEAINGVSYRPGTRFGDALAAAIERGRVVKHGDRYHLSEGETP